MPGRTVKRLLDLEVDEISLVDRPANQHGLVAIAKRAEDVGMPIFDDEGYQVDEADLVHGDLVYDESGQELVYVDDTEDELVADDGGTSYEFDDEHELAGVGKAFTTNAAGVTHKTGELARRTRRGAAWGHARQVGQAAQEWRKAGPIPERVARASRNAPGRARRVSGRIAGQKDARTAAYVAGGTAGVGGYEGGKHFGKSLGESVYEELSKALNDGDRDQVISKMGDLVQEAREEAAAAWEFAKGLADERELDDYTQLAEGYDLPVAPAQLGGVLKRAAERLPEGDLALLDRVFSAAGVGFEELGYNGAAEASVMGQVHAMAAEAVGKSDLTSEQAITAMFDANPEAYEQYLAESR